MSGIEIPSKSGLDFVVLTPAYAYGCASAPSWFTSYFIEVLVSGNGSWAPAWRQDTGAGRDAVVGCSHGDFPIAAWDLDSDGQAEVITRFGPNGSRLAVLDGLTGAERASVEWPYWNATDGTQWPHMIEVPWLQYVEVLDNRCVS